jgi:enoyl-CoA hydratase/carnithine racemase
MVNGPAVGFGAELALGADIRIAGASAKFRFPFSLLGTVSDTGAATWLLPRLVGWSRAAELLYSGRVVEAAEAAEIGLVNRVVPDDDLVGAVDELARTLAQRSAWSLRQLKLMIFAGLDERKGEHVLRQHFAFLQRDSSADPAAYFASVRGHGSDAS